MRSLFYRCLLTCSVPTVTYVADRLLKEYSAGSNSTATQLLDHFDVIIVPILNVDGFDYTWNGDRMWRKTRTPNSGSPCDGTDPNRNWNFHWGEAGTSTKKCSDSYQVSPPPRRLSRRK